jgi:hypothetical protein
VVADDLARAGDEVALEELEAGVGAPALVGVAVHAGRDDLGAAVADVGGDQAQCGRAGLAGVDLDERGQLEQRLGGRLAGVAIDGQLVAVLAQPAEALEQRLVGRAVGGDLQDHALGPERQRVHREQELGRDVEERGGAPGGRAQPELAQRRGGDPRGRGVRAVLPVTPVQELVAGQPSLGIQDRLACEEHFDVGRGRGGRLGKLLGHRSR